MPMKRVTVRRWEIGVGFLLIVAAMVGMGILLKIDINRNSSIIQTKASIAQLERGECVLKNFLASSAGVRERLAENDKTRQARQKDLEASHQAAKLAHGLANQKCPN